METKDGLGTIIRLTVEGMKYQIVEVLSMREKQIKSAIEEYVNSDSVVEDITVEIKRQTNIWISGLVSDALQEVISDEVKKNKEIKKIVTDSIKNNSTAIAEAIYQKYIK